MTVPMKEIEALIGQGLVREKKYENGLSVLKYHNKVFYKNLWTPTLEECRGLVIDTFFRKPVMRPFRKVYNYLENGTCEGLPMDTPVRIVQKLNGFMAQATGMYEGSRRETLVGTTGTLDSDFATLARCVIHNQVIPGAWDPNPNSNLTWLFEICDASDPHIVDEEEGAYLIGIRCNSSGYLVSEHELDKLATEMGFLRPYHLEVTFGEALELRASCQHEGYIVQDLGGKVLCKLKSQHYLAKKALMRMGKARCSLMYNNTAEFKKQLDEEFYTLVDWIIENYTLDQYMELSQDSRRNLFDNYYSNTEAF